MVINRREKGNRAEREVVKTLSGWTGEKFSRRGTGNSGDDIISPAKFPWSVEVKDHASVRFTHLFDATKLLGDFFAQAVKNATDSKKMPLLVVKIQGSWYAVEALIMAKTQGCRAYLKNVFGDHSVIIRPFDQFLYDYDDEK